MGYINSHIAMCLKGKLVQTRAQLIGQTAADGESYGTGVVKLLADYPWLHVLDNFHYRIHHWVSECIRNLLFYKPRLLYTMVKSISSRRTIGNDKTARSKVYATIIANYNN